MKQSQKGNVAVIAIIIVIVAITAGIAGWWLFAKKSQVPVQQSATTQPIAQLSTDAATDWQIYQNEKLGFELKYPKDWKISDANSVIYIRSPRSNNEIYPFAIHISSIAGQYQNSRQAFDVKIFPGLRTDIDHEVKDIKFNDYDAVSFADLGMTDTINIVLTNAGNILRISYTADEQDITQINQVLSTFKFIKKDETADCKSYKNDKYGFEFQYPKEWQPDDSNSDKSVTFFMSNKDGRGHDYEFSAAVIGNINKGAAEFLMHDKSEGNIIREKTTFLGTDAIKITNIVKNGIFGSRGSVSYHFIKNGNGFLLTSNYVGEDNSISEKLFNAFKFTK